MSRLNWSDPEAVRRLLVDLRVAVDDADGVIRDALRPPRRRELGRVLHRRNYRDARQRIVALLAFATPEPERGDPSGLGGAGPVH